MWENAYLSIKNPKASRAIKNSFDVYPFSSIVFAFASAFAQSQ